MKYRKGDFIVAPNKEVALKLRGASLNVYLALCAHADEGGGCFPSIAKISEQTEYSRDAVKTALKELATTKSLISIEARRRDNGSTTSNYYQILLWEDEGGVSTHTEGGCVQSPSITQPLNSQKNIKKKESLKLLLEELISLVNPKEKPTEDRQRLLSARLKEYSFGEIKNAARAFSGSQWHREHGQMSIDNLLRPSKFGRWYAAGLKLEPEADAVEDPIVKAAGDAFPARWPKGKPEWSEDDDENRYFRGVKIDHTNQGEIMKIEEARRGA